MGGGMEKARFYYGNKTTQYPVRDIIAIHFVAITSITPLEFYLSLATYMFYLIE